MREQDIEEVARSMRVPAGAIARIVGRITPPAAGTVEWITHVLSGTSTDEWYGRMVADREKSPASRARIRAYDRVESADWARVQSLKARVTTRAGNGAYER